MTLTPQTDLAVAQALLEQKAEIDRLRDLVKRLITVHENIYWRRDEQTGMLYVGCTIDEEKIRKTIEEARDALKTSEQYLEE